MKDVREIYLVYIVSNCKYMTLEKIDVFLKLRILTSLQTNLIIMTFN